MILQGWLYGCDDMYIFWKITGMRWRENPWTFFEARFVDGYVVICLRHVCLDSLKSREERNEAKVFPSVIGEGSGVLRLLGGLLLADRL